MSEVRKEYFCSVCEQNRKPDQECGRAVCGMRRPLTANVPDESRVNFFFGGSHRRTALDEN